MGIYVPQNLIRDPEYTATDVSTWCFAAICVYGPFKDAELLSGSQILFQMFGTIDKSASKISQSLKHLIHTGILHGEQLDNSNCVVYKDSFDMRQWDRFISVDIEDIKLIMKQCSRPFSVLRYYLLMLSTIDPNKKYGMWKNETIANILGDDNTTVTRNIKILERLELLFIYRGMYSSNTYGRYKDKNKIIAAGKTRSNGKQLYFSANRKRQMTQWYNQIKRGNPKYTNNKALVNEVREFCELINSQQEELMIQNPNYIPKLYDLSVFS